jgi:hypothetical protein
MKIDDVHGDLVMERFRVRRLLASLPRWIEVPSDLECYEESLSTLEVVISDLAQAVAIKKRVTDADVRLNPNFAKALGFEVTDETADDS